MRKAAIVLIVLGVLGCGLGVYGIVMTQSATDIIENNTKTLHDKFPRLKDAADLTKIEDLIAVDRVLKDKGDPETKDLAWDILNAMMDQEDGENLRNYSFGGGGLLLVIGLALFFIGAKKD